MSISHIRFTLGGLLLFAAFNPLSGATIDWTTWTSQPTSTSADGTLTVGTQSVSVSYSGEISFTQLNGTGTNFYQPLATFTSPPTVTNAPPSDMIAITGNSTTHTISFGASVVNPIMEIVSLGQPSLGTMYDFSLSAGQSMSILAQGPSDAYGGCNTCLSLSGTTLTGHEGDGIIQFTGTYTSLSWTGASPEYWNGFTFGVTGVGSTPPPSVPEPATWGMLLAAFVLGAPLALRRMRA